MSRKSYHIDARIWEKYMYGMQECIQYKGRDLLTSEKELNCLSHHVSKYKCAILTTVINSPNKYLVCFLPALCYTCSYKYFQTLRISLNLMSNCLSYIFLIQLKQKKTFEVFIMFNTLSHMLTVTACNAHFENVKLGCGKLVYIL